MFILFFAVVCFCIIQKPLYSHEKINQYHKGEKNLNENAVRVAFIFLREAKVLKEKGNYHDAIRMTEKALVILEKTFGSEHIHVSEILTILARLNQASGEYEKTILLYTRALKIKENTLGSNHQEVGSLLHALAKVYNFRGDYAASEPLLQRALAIYEKTLDPEHLDLAKCLDDLASVYSSMGEFGRAKHLFEQSLAIREKVLGPDHQDIAISLSSLANLYFWEFEWPKAESFFKRSLDIRELAFGSKHPKVAWSLLDLGNFYSFVGEYRKALNLHERAFDIFTKNFGPDHLSVGMCLGGLARTYQSLGDYDKAEFHYIRSLEIEEASLGCEHPGLSGTLHNLATLYNDLGKFRNAHFLLMRGKKIEDKLIDRLRGFFSEERAFRVLATWWANLEMDLTLVAQHFSDNPAFLKDALDLCLSRKGLTLDLGRNFHRTLVSSDDPEVKGTVEELNEVRGQIAQIYFSRPVKADTKEYRHKIARLLNKKKELEETLSRFDSVLVSKKKAYKADSNEVAQALPENSALLEFVRLDPFRSRSKSNNKPVEWSDTRYLAFVLRAGIADRVDLIDLGVAEEIDRTVKRLRNEMMDDAQRGSNNCLETLSILHELVFKPVKKALGDSKRIFISPDGFLNLIPFEVLKEPTGHFLIEDYTFNYLAAGRDILDFGSAQGKGGKALLIGDPDFNLSYEDKETNLKGIISKGNGGRDTMKHLPYMRDFCFMRLPGTREEVDCIHYLLGRERSVVYTGSEALEEVLMGTESPNILHLATHGFFLKDLDTRHLLGELAGRGINPVSMIPSNETVSIARGGNPLVRSGFALAGANVVLGSDELERSDGIVTAEEILGLKLMGTDMVVLSACETGVGGLKIYEGIYGLRRAFMQAGARSLVMSMWSVPDRETKELMIEFYKGIISGRMNRCQALRQAALKQLKIVRRRYGHANPFYWGAFIFLGEP